MGIILELFEDECQAITCSFTDFADLIMTELEEHGQEFVVDDVLFEKLSILSEILSDN